MSQTATLMVAEYGGMIEFSSLFSYLLRTPLESITLNEKVVSCYADQNRYLKFKGPYSFKI